MPRLYPAADIVSEGGGLISFSLSLFRSGDIATRRGAADGFLSILASPSCDSIFAAVDERVRDKHGAIEKHADVCISLIRLATGDDDWEVKCSLSRIIAALFGLTCT